MSSSAPTLRPIVFTCLSLLSLTLVTSLLSLLNLGSLNLAVGVFIAAIQAALIAFFLMHALYGSPLFRVVLAGGVIWFLILETLTWTDYWTRGW